MRREYISEEWRPFLAAVRFDRPLALLDTPELNEAAGGDWTLLSKPGLVGRQRWRCTIASESNGPRVIYVKRYDAPRWKQQWDRIVRQAGAHSAAWWEYCQARRLAQLRVPAASPIACAEEMRGPFESRSAVLLGAVPGDAFDRHWVAAIGKRDPIVHGMARHDTTRRLARFVAAFHQTGYRHRDLYLCHIFMHRPGGAGPPQFNLIDLARTFRPRVRRTRWLVKDLSQLDSSARQIGASRGDRLRFLLAYLGLQRATPRVRRLIRRIVAKSDAILRRVARKGG